MPFPACCSDSITTVEEEGDATDNELVSATVRGHVEGAEELLSIEVEVERSLDGSLLGVRVGIAIRDPGQVADRKVDHLQGLATNLIHSHAIKGATLEPEVLHLDRTIAELALFERRDKFELVDGDLIDPGRLLAERVQEGLRVEQVRDVDRLIEEGARLDTLHPLDKLRALLAKYTDPRLRVLWALPQLLPSHRNRVLQKCSRLGLNLGCQHLSTLEHFDDTGHTFSHECNDLLDRDHLHVDKLVDRVGSSQLFTPDSHRLEHFNLEDVLPELQDWCQLLGPLLLVESELFGRDCTQ